MSGNIHLKEVSASTIEILESLLEQAKSGELVGIAYIGVKQGERNRYGWADDAGHDPLATLGGIREAQNGAIGRERVLSQEARYLSGLIILFKFKISSFHAAVHKERWICISSHGTYTRPCASLATNSCLRSACTSVCTLL